jgi:hypothetical protein
MGTWEPLLGNLYLEPVHQNDIPPRYVVKSSFDKCCGFDVYYDFSLMKKRKALLCEVEWGLGAR